MDAGFGRGGMRVRVALLRPLLVAADLTSSYRHALPDRHSCDHPVELRLHRNLLEVWRDSAPQNMDQKAQLVPGLGVVCGLRATIAGAAPVLGVSSNRRRW